MGKMDLLTQRNELAQKLEEATEQGDRGMVAYYKILLGLIDKEINEVGDDSAKNQFRMNAQGQG